MFETAIAARAVGQYPLSVATSLALESANGIHPEIVAEYPPIRRYQELWVNTRTLFRNFMGALDKDTYRGVRPDEIAEALAQEMEQIVSIIPAKVQFYVSNYARLEQEYPHATVRVDNTDAQKVYTLLQTQAIELLLKHHPEIGVVPLKLHAPTHPKALILTHYAFDLLAHKEFSLLNLVESHTGKIKTRAQWYTKYYQGRELAMIPFREDFLQVFGDNETFRPMDRKLREAIVEVAKKYSWSSVTTREKLMYGIEQIPNPFFVATLKQMMVRG